MSETVYRPYKAKCADGVVRTARVRCYWDGRSWCMHGDTYFSVPAFVKVKGKTVRGYVTGNDDHRDDPSQPEHEFRAYLYRKNHASIVAVTA